MQRRSKVTERLSEDINGLLFQLVEIVHGLSFFSEDVRVFG
jgi:hypothetical protein